MFLNGHLHFFLYFVFTLVGQFFSGQTLFDSIFPFDFAADLFDMSTYIDLKNEFLRRKMLFKDPKFPADDTSLYYKNEELAENIKWLRPKEVNLAVPSLH